MTLACRCKFAHPKTESEDDRKIPFCKDFRARNCRYQQCIYVHAPDLLEQEYLRTGNEGAEAAGQEH